MTAEKCMRSDDRTTLPQGDAQPSGRDRLQRCAEDVRREQISARTSDASSTEIQQKSRDLEQRFHIKIAPPGEVLGPQFDPQTHKFTDDKVRTRQPTMRELQGLEAGLERSYPASLTRDGKPLRVEFQDKDFVKGRSAEANYIRPHGSVPAQLRIGPGAQLLPPTEKDVVTRDPRNPNLNSLEGLLSHELAHGTELNVAGHMDGREASYYRAMGWQPMQRTPGEGTSWALKGRDGSLYESAGPDPREGFYRREGGKGYDAKGNYLGRYLDKDGAPIAGYPKPEDAVPGDRVRELAEVRPASAYFTAPREMMAESLAQYRLSEDTRRKLLQESPRLYEATKSLDQQELNIFTHGSKMRMPDGSLVEKSTANGQAVAAWEVRVHH